MNIDRAKALARESGFSLRQGVTQWDWDLYDSHGVHLDTLHTQQIQHLAEDDYIEFYLN